MKKARVTSRTLQAWAMVAACGAGAYAQDGPTCDAKFQTPDGGMAAYWTFNDKGAPLVDDYAGYGGVNYGSTWTADGAVGGAMHFDGVSDYADISDPSLNVPTWPQFTIAVWFLNDGGGDHVGYGQKVFDKSTINSDFQLRLHPSGDLNFWAGSPENSWANINDHTHDYRCNEWHQAVIVKKGPHGELWVDGVLKGTADDLGSPSNGQPFLLGYTFHGDTYQRNHWSGLIDEFAIFDRMLNADEVKDLYAASIAGKDYCQGECGADLDGSYSLDLFDYLMFINLFNANDPKADCTGDGVHDLFDFLCYTDAFNAGCPS